MSSSSPKKLTRQKRLEQRNEKVRNLYNQYCKKHPQWRSDAVIAEIEKIVFLSPRTIEAILNCEGIYNTEPETRK